MPFQALTDLRRRMRRLLPWPQSPEPVGLSLGPGSALTQGALLWTPSADWIAATNLTRYMTWLKTSRGLSFTNYTELWHWSVADISGFWASMWDYFRVESSAPYIEVLGQRPMPNAEWFAGARLNYAQHALRHEAPGKAALLFESETTPLTPVLWEDLAGQVRILATRLRALGVARGERVCSYMPNVPETLVAMLATTSIGAVWSSCAPDFGPSGVLDRFRQIKPTVLFCVDGFRNGGKDFDRRDAVNEIISALPDLRLVVFVPRLSPTNELGCWPHLRRWAELLDSPPVPADGFRFEQVPFDHPLWILFSSGTTGLPKPIVQGHGGIALEMMKHVTFTMDICPGDIPFFYTTAGWIMWNFLVSSLLVGACPVLYDGNPGYPEADRLWRMAQDARVTYFGSSPTFIDTMSRAGIVPREKYELSRLRAVMLAGSPVSAECGAWVYRSVKQNLWLCTGSGATDICTGMVGGVANQPVYAGEMQGPSLGVAVAAFNEAGESVVGEVGELVITQPMPSMPLFFWGDDDGSRYREAYFDVYPGIWRHGDFFRINERGGCFVLGRSDATLNRFGVRIGTAEIYRALARVANIENALIVNLDLPGGRFFMPLFVQLAPGLVLDNALIRRVRTTLRQQYTSNHVPDKIYQVPAIPMTLTGKKMEVPIRRILMGVDPAKAINRHAMAKPEALTWFLDYARDQTDYRLC